MQQKRSINIKFYNGIKIKLEKDQVMEAKKAYSGCFIAVIDVAIKI